MISSSDIKSQNTNQIVEVRSYNLKPGTRQAFNQLFEKEALPMLDKWGIKVLLYGASQHDSDSYFLIRAFNHIDERQKAEDAFYGSIEWKQGPREAILALIENFTTVVLPISSLQIISSKINNMITGESNKADSAVLSAINKQFIDNFLKQDMQSHNKIIHKNFVCIESNGNIVQRDLYLKNWATDFDNSGYTSFSYQDEAIRIFGNTALVRAKTVYTKLVHKKSITGYTIYTDTYLKEDGEWKCVQVQITPVK
ncbi:MAG TPA: DUF4440 domain-containing protein [Chitinophagaceae bacterium]|nr:DUF4440 domain-containing protein [Chitinophagaceae bacterium]